MLFFPDAFYLFLFLGTGRRKRCVHACRYCYFRLLDSLDTCNLGSINCGLQINTFSRWCLIFLNPILPVGCPFLWNFAGNAPESDKKDLLSELEVMKTLNPHPHVIKLLGCITESGKTLTLWTFTVTNILGAYLIASIIIVYSLLVSI